MKRFLLSIALSLLMSMPFNLVQASEEDDCSVVLCMWGLLQNFSGGEDCSSYEDTYFSTKVFKLGSFKKSATAQARFNLLDKCKTASTEDKSAINNVFGTLLHKP